MSTSSASSASWRLTNLRGVRATLVVVLVVAAVLVDIGTAEAVQIPETLADGRPVQAGPVETSFPIDYLGVLWDAPGYQPTDTDHHHGAEPHGAVRFRHDGVWGPWVSFIEDGAEAAGQWASGLIPAGDADAYQVRGVPAGAVLPQAVALNTTDGPLVTVGTRPAGAAGALANCLSRAQWGADESLRLSDDGDGATEVWPPAFYPVQAMTVHHTAGSNNDPDPAATVRAIYRFHAVDRGWGDIGYHYLIDEQGFIYEGRWSGEASSRCDAGGDGSDFAHNAAGHLVTAGHTGGYNSGNIGAALLGTFTDVGPKPAAVGALEGVLAENASRHGLDPQGTVNYVNPVNLNTTTADTISGHRDWTATECPGERLYAQLPDIRVNVAALMGPSPPVADAGPDQTVSDADGSGVETITLDGSASFDPDGTIVSYRWTEGATVLGITANITSDFTIGGHTVTLTVTDNDGATAADTVVVTVNQNQPPVANAGPDQSALVGAVVNFDGSASSDTEGTIVSYDWDFGDGVTASGVMVGHIYTSAGTYTVTLTVTDNGGLTGQDTAVATITDVPVDVVTITKATYDNGKTKLEVEATSSEGGVAVLTVEGFGAMTYNAKKNVYRLRLTGVANPGSVTVTSSLGGTDTATVTEKGGAPPSNQPPVADAGPDQTVIDTNGDGIGIESVALDGSASSDPDGTITTYEWSEGGSLIATGVTPVVALAVGNHTITLTVTDNGGATASDTVLISVVDPLAGITLTATGYKVKGLQKADLDWLGATSTQVDVYRDGTLIATTTNDGFYTDNIDKKGGGSYVYWVCEAGTTICSNTSTVTY